MVNTDADFHPFKPVVLRAWLISIALKLSFTVDELDSVRNRLESVIGEEDLEQHVRIEPDLADDIYRVLSRGLSSDIARDLIPNLDITLFHTLVIESTFNFKRQEKSISEVVIFYYPDFYKLGLNIDADLDLDDELGKLSHTLEEFGYSELSEATKQLLVPSSDAHNYERAKFQFSLIEINKQFRELSGINRLSKWSSEDEAKIKDMRWTRESSGLIYDYLKATKLLVDCLSLAVVDERDSIEEKLLLPGNLQ